MSSLLFALAKWWIGRAAKPDPEALARVTHLRPAVIVTGGSSGIGFAIAGEFARRGNAVVLIARNAERLDVARLALIASAQSSAPPVIALAADVTRENIVVDIEAALAQHGLYLDTLVNSAGVGLAGSFDSHSAAEIDRLLALNIAALTRLTRSALPAMKARARGGILNVSSLGGYVPGPNQAAYYASKAYVCSLTEALSSECAGTGVRVTVVAPGPVETGFHAAMGTDDALYRWLFPAVTPEHAARSAYNGYQMGRSVVVPGLISKALAVAVCVIPHWLTLPLLRVLLAPRR